MGSAALRATHPSPGTVERFALVVQQIQRSLLRLSIQRHCFGLHFKSKTPRFVGTTTRANFAQPVHAAYSRLNARKFARSSTCMRNVDQFRRVRFDARTVSAAINVDQRGKRNVVRGGVIRNRLCCRQIVDKNLQRETCTN